MIFRSPTFHQLYIPSDEGLLKLLDGLSAESKGKKRRETLDAATKTIKPFLEALRKHLNSQS